MTIGQYSEGRKQVQKQASQCCTITAHLEEQEDTVQVCYLTKLHPVFEDKELIYKMLSSLIIEHLPATVWDTNTFVTHSAMVKRSLIRHQLADGFLESVFHTGNPVYVNSYRMWLPCLINNHFASPVWQTVMLLLRSIPACQQEVRTSFLITSGLTERYNVIVMKQSTL